MWNVKKHNSRVILNGALAGLRGLSAELKDLQFPVSLRVQGARSDGSAFSRLLRP